MTIDTIPKHPALGNPRTTAAPRLTVVVRSLLSLLALMAERQRSRVALREMTAEQLRDIGITRSDAMREGRRPIWDWTGRL